jgi:very-short-patch-repair endonuclease
MLAQLDAWRRDLIDFSRRNRLLNMSGRGTVIELIEPSSEIIVSRLLKLMALRVMSKSDNGESEDEEVDSVSAKDAKNESSKDLSKGLTDGEIVELLETQVRSSVGDSSKLASSLRTLRRRADQEFLDKGIRILYLAVGELHWEESGEEWVSPILMLPINLERVSEGIYDIRLNTDEEPALNPALVEKLREDLDVDIDCEFDEDQPTLLFKQIRQRIEAKKSWHVEDRLRIGVFSFSKDVMYRDLKANEAAAAANVMVQALAFGSDSTQRLGFDKIDPKVLDEIAPPSKLASILDADATQRTAIVAARDGKSFVMDGPPGTGKSQTIANIITELIAGGKSVLFVSEKAAALEVVQSRLDDAGLGSFLLPLHSQKVSRKDFASLLMKSVNERAVAGKSLSVAQVERLNNNQKKLSSYVAALNETRLPLGISLHNAIGEHAKLANYPNAPVPTSSIGNSLSPTMRLEIEDATTRLARSWTQVEEEPAFHWRGLLNPRTAQSNVVQIINALEKMKDALSTAHTIGQSVSEETGASYDDSIPSLKALGDLIDLTATSFEVPTDWLQTSEWDAFQSEIETLCQDIEHTREQKLSLDAGLPAWDKIDKDFAGTVDRFLGALSNSDCIQPAEDLTVGGLRKLLHFYAAELKNVDDALRLTGILEDKLGDPTTKTTVERSRILCEGALLASAAHRPESMWFTAIGITAVSDAISQIQPIVDNYWLRVEKLDETFKRDVLEFPISTIFAQSETTPQLNVFSGAGRANRRSLAALSNSGKLGKEERAKLVEVLALSKSREALALTDQRRLVFGQMYYQGVDTDFQLLSEALEVAKQAVILLKKADPTKLASALGRVALDVAETTHIGEQASTCLDRIADAHELITGRSMSAEIGLEEFAIQLKSGHDLLEKLLDFLVQNFGQCDEQTLGGLGEYAAMTKALRGALEGLQDNEASFRKIVGTYFSGLDTDTNLVRSARTWAGGIRSALTVTPSRRLAERLMVGPLGPENLLSGVVAEFLEGMDQFVLLFNSTRADELSSVLGFDVAGSQQLFSDLIESIEQISEEVSFQESIEALREYGLGEVVEFLRNKRIDRESLPQIVEKAVLAAWIESILDSDRSRIEPAEKTHRDQLVKDFRMTDRILKHDAASKVAELANARRPTGAIGAVGLIQRESARKSRHMRISELLENTKEVAQSIKPCFMMSPLSVSTFLPPSMIFDAVIFDEASQLLTSNAINAIYRGRQLIIAGDEKQLPPTNFFARGLNEDEGDEYDEDQVEEFESILNQAKSGGFEEIGLRWHYRSRHESLITYSNYSFYDGKLVTYPGALQESDELGVKFIHVPDGVYKRSGSRTNTIEAQNVVERVLYHADHHPHMSLGVVAFSTAQQTEIQNQLDVACLERPDLEDYFHSDRLNGFFIKNLESVQGDERDIVIFSVGYGRDELGKLTMGFGPVNLKGGWRRLNVAFTRARNRIEVVSSITAGDFFDSSSVNVNYLKRYLDFAERGIAALAYEVNPQAGDAESPFEEEVLRIINSWGYDVTPQVGQAGYRIDMAIRNPERPGEYVLGIECDGAAYHSSPVARDRDRLRQEVLEGLGWRLYRIWGPTWYRSPATAHQQLREAIEESLKSRPLHGRNNLTKEVTIRNEVVEVELDESSRFVHPYVFDPKLAAPKISQNFGKISIDSIAAFILQTVVREGPISRNLVRRRLVISAGVGLSADLRSRIDTQIAALVKAGTITEIDFDCLATVDQAWLVMARQPNPRDPLTKRSPADTPLIEVVAAVAHVIELGHTIDLVEAQSNIVRRVFGFDRVTAQWKELIDVAVEEMVRDSWCTLDGEVLSKGEDFPE